MADRLKLKSARLRLQGSIAHCTLAYISGSYSKALSLFARFVVICMYLGKLSEEQYAICQEHEFENCDITFYSSTGLS